MNAILQSRQQYRRLYRAFVSLPSSMKEHDRAMQERIVFFESPAQGECAHLENLLAVIWAMDTTNWCRDGHIYNVCHAYELIAENLSESVDARLLEIGCEGTALIHYANAADVDFLLTPQLHRRLTEALRATCVGQEAQP